MTTRILTQAVNLRDVTATRVDTGEVFTRTELGRFLVPLASLIHDQAHALVARGWNRETLEALRTGVAPGGASLAGKGYVRVRALGLVESWPEGVYASERVGRMAREVAARTLTSAAEHMALTQHVLDTWHTLDRKPATGDLTGDGDAGWGRRVIKQVARHVTRAGMIPVSAFEVREAPTVPVMVPIAVTDTQYATRSWDQDGRYAVEFAAPTTPAPKKTDWVRVRLEGVIAGERPAGNVAYSAPTIIWPSGVGGDCRILITATTTVPVHDTTTASRWLGVDLNMGADGDVAACGVISQAQDGGLVTPGVTYFTNLKPLLDKRARIQWEAEATRAKAAHLDALGLNERAVLLHTKTGELNAKRAHLTTVIARATAARITTIATATGVDAIVIEDLASLEAGGFGASVNNAIAQYPRAKIALALNQAALRAGFQVVMVNARGTSSNCPACDQPVRHPHHRTTICPTCGLRCHRDGGAAVKIASRAAANKGKETRRGSDPMPRIRRVTFQPVNLDTSTRREVPTRRVIDRKTTRFAGVLPRATSTAAMRSEWERARRRRTKRGYAHPHTTKVATPKSDPRTPAGLSRQTTHAEREPTQVLQERHQPLRN